MTVDNSNNVCNNQKMFNEAFDKAIENRRNKYSWDSMNSYQKVSSILFLILYFVLTAWAVMLALRVEGKTRVINVVAAFLFGPLYLISYFISKPNN